MKLSLAIGKREQIVELNDNNVLGLLVPNKVEIQSKGIEAVKKAIENPIGTKRLKDIVSHGEKIVIVTSDITRPMPSKLVMPLLIEELCLAGVDTKDITIVFALGSHRFHTEEEKKYIVGEDVYSKVKCIDSDSNNSVFLGITSRGTPVEIFSPVAEADRVICLGNIEYHYFAGYSGGAKAIMPGVATRRAIQANHSMMVMDSAYAGAIDTNPLRQDIEEVAIWVKIDFILNVVLDEMKNIIEAVAGHYIEAHRAGCRFLDGLYKVPIDQKADIVIVSAGGYPKDINLYQAQKALDNAKHAVKQNGIIILLASCQEGFGEKVFESWMTGSKSSAEMIERIKVKFELGGHKAAAIAGVLQNADIYLVSDLEPEIVKSIYMEPFSDVNDALNSAFDVLGPDSNVYIMPYGGSTLPSEIKEFMYMKL